MSIKSAIRDILAADGTLAGLLTGGFYVAVEMKRTGDTAAAFNADGEILPSALVKQAVEVPDGPRELSGRALIDIYLYQFAGTAAIDAAKERIFTLLNELHIGSERVWEVKWITDITDQEDPALECSMHLCRYEAIRYRG